MYDYDLLVIGAGSGGVRASRLAAATGARVAVAEERYLGGTCVNVGCVPKKIFYYGSHFNKDFSDAKGYGWDLSVNHFDWPTLRDNKNIEITRLNGIYQSMLENAGVTIFPSRAEIVGPHKALLGEKTITAKKILIAAGGRPHVPEFPGAELAVCSDDIFYLEQLPNRALIVGGGYIAVEFASIFQGLGVNTEMAYRGLQLLRMFDEDLGSRLASELMNKGITVSFEMDVDRIVKKDRHSLTVSFKNGRIDDYDLVLFATGRKAYTANLGLESTLVELRSDGSIIVDDYFQTREPSIFALGDIIGTPELTPVALAQAMAFVDGQFKQQPRTIDYTYIPTAVFSQPNIATVGLTEADALKRFNEISIYRSEFKTLKHSLSKNNERTFMKLIVDVASDKVIGVHMMGSEASEIIQGFAVAMKAGATKAVFDETIGVHPTIAEEFVTMRTAS